MKRIILGAIAVLVLASCANTKYAPESLRNNLDNVAILTPMSYIDYVDESGHAWPDDSLSAMSQEVLINALYNSALPISKYIPVNFLAAGENFENEIAALERVDPKNVPNLTIPRYIDQLLEENGERFGVMLFSYGFERDRKGYAKEVAADVAATVLSTALAVLLGIGVSTYGVTAKNESHIFAVIYDSLADSVVFYNTTANFNEGISPLKQEAVQKQIDKIFKCIWK